MTPNREFALVAVLATAAVALVALAALTRSYLPLFFAWIPQVAIPVLLSRFKGRGAPGPPPEAERDEPGASSA